MRTIEASVDGAPDFELGRARTEPLRYVADLPDGPATGLAFLIPGFGQDTDSGYAAALRRHVVETHGMAAVSVRYHCIGARPDSGATIEIDTRDRLMLVGLAAVNGVKLGNPNDTMDVARRLAKAGLSATLAGTLRPARGEYQNFGVMQALDHLAAFGDLCARGVEFDRSRVVALGSSHGGYIAHLMAKFAPRLLAMVIDNSSYTRPPMQYMGQESGAEYILGMADGIVLRCGVESAWTLADRAAPNFYDRDRDLIRDTAFEPHLRLAYAAAGDGGTVFRMVNAAVDTISPPAQKTRQVEALRAAGFDARLFIVDQDEIDGKLFKRLVHGLDASLAGLFDLAVHELQPRAVDGLGTEVALPCIDGAYRFTGVDQAPWVRAEVLAPQGTAGEEVSQAA